MEYTVNLGKESLKKIANAIGGVDVQELEVTQNGVYTAPDGKAYSPVRVNVEGGGGGSSDFSTAVVKSLSSNTGVPLSNLKELCYIVHSPVGDRITSSPRPYNLTPDGLEYKIVLYKGVANTFLTAESADAYNITVTGDISYEYSEDDAAFNIDIEGNGTIRIEQA